MKKLYVVLLIVILCIFVASNNNLNKIITVKATKTDTIEYIPYITVGGEFENSEKTVVSLSYPICVDKVYVQQNQYVNSGQPLFSLDTEKMRSILSGQFDYEIIEKINYDNMIKLQNEKTTFDMGAIPQVIYASANGYIEELIISDGDVAMDNTRLVTIASNTDILARFSLSQQDFGKISVGDNVNISSVAFADSNYKGKITDKNAVVKKQTSVSGSKVVVDVFAHIDNPDKRVSHGLQITGKIQSGPAKFINVLDYKFISQDEKGEYVYILSKGKAKKTYIETGIETEDYTELLTEFPMETIFLSGEITDGSRVLISE